jgi:hypothetical protein
LSTEAFVNVLDFRLDFIGGAQADERTVAHDYLPVPLSDLGVAAEEPEAALDALLPRLADHAQRIGPAEQASGATAVLLVAVVRAPRVDSDDTSEAEVGSNLSAWREVARLDWPHEAGSEEERAAAYSLIERMDLRSSEKPPRRS